ncbi:MAG: PorV/PorQ family protein [Bacteroidota bacterium]
MMMSVKRYIWLLFASLPVLLHAQTAPKYSNEFLSIGVGARALGMSNAVVASSQGVMSGYWNPAAMTELDQEMEIGLMHAEYFAGVAAFDFGSAIYRLDEKTVMGGSLIRFGVDNIPNTLDLIDNDGNIRYDRLSAFSASDLAVIFSFARLSKVKNLSLGGNAKIIRRKAGDFGGAWGFGLDFSALYTTDKWLFAAMAKDVTSTFNAWSFNQEVLAETWLQTGNYLPESSLEISLPTLNLGVARRIPIVSKLSALAEINLYNSFDGKRNTLLKTNFISLDPRAGIEFNWDKKVFLRSGLGQFQEIPLSNGEKEHSVQLSIGAGIAFRNFSVDYALSSPGDSNNFYSHVFSLRYSFDIDTENSSNARL